MTTDRPRSRRRDRVSLFRGGEAVGRVFWFDRAAGVAGVFLMGASLAGTFARVRVARLTGTRRFRPVSAAAVRAEVEARAGVSFGAATAEAVETEATEPAAEAA